MKSSTNALVIYGSSGRTVQISLQDLKMPDHVKKRKNSSFFEKQWSTVAAFWYNRVQKEFLLQQKSISDIVQLIENDIERRWEKRKLESTLHKRSRRLLSKESAGPPTKSILLTNVCSFSEYSDMSEELKKKLTTILQEKVQALASCDVLETKIFIDPTNSISTEPHEKKKKSDTEEIIDSFAPENEFDDSIAFVFSVKSKELAAKAIVQLHGERINDRHVLCRFWNS